MKHVTKAPHLDLTPAERAALRGAGVVLRDLAALEPRQLAQRVGGAIPSARCAELVRLARFQVLGSVSLETARDFVQLGFERVDDLRGQDPIELYRRMCTLTRSRQDPCVEDAFRCAIAQAERPELPPRWRQWFHWTPLRGQPAGTWPAGLSRARAKRG